MLWLASAITAYIKIPALFCCYYSKILALRFGAFPDASANSRFQFMWCAQTTVAFLYADGITHAVVQSKAAPGAAYATFNRTQCFSISMPTFKTCGDQFLPY